MLYPTSSTFPAAQEALLVGHELGGFWDGASITWPFGVRPYEGLESDLLVDELDDDFLPFFDGPLIYPPNLALDRNRANSWTFEMSLSFNGLSFFADFGDYTLGGNAQILIQPVDVDDPHQSLIIGFSFTAGLRHGWVDKKWSPGFLMLLSGNNDGESSQVTQQGGIGRSPSAFEVTISGESFPMFYSTAFSFNNDMSGYLNLKPLTWD
jgi:hypothetical protein